MNIKQTITVAITTILVACGAIAQDYTHFPGAPLDRKTLEAQQTVEVLYSNNEYKRCLFIYKNELASIGDKYAQYMVGFMYLHGQGVEQSRPAALAWYRLAAEREEQAIIQARNNLYDTMSHEEVVESNRIYADLWRELGDNRLLLDLIKQDLAVLNERTGSRVGRTSISPVTIVGGADGAPATDAYYDRVRARMEMRLSYLETNVEIIDLELDDDIAVAKRLEQELREEVAALDIR